MMKLTSLIVTAAAFYVKDKAILYGLTVGDEVDFVHEYKHPAETIVSITKSQ